MQLPFLCNPQGINRSTDVKDPMTYLVSPLTIKKLNQNKKPRCSYITIKQNNKCLSW